LQQNWPGHCPILAQFPWPVEGENGENGWHPMQDPADPFLFAPADAPVSLAQGKVGDQGWQESRLGGVAALLEEVEERAREVAGTRAVEATHVEDMSAARCEPTLSAIITSSDAMGLGDYDLGDFTELSEPSDPQVGMKRPALTGARGAGMRPGGQTCFGKKQRREEPVDGGRVGLVVEVPAGPTPPSPRGGAAQTVPGEAGGAQSPAPRKARPPQVQKGGEVAMASCAIAREEQKRYMKMRIEAAKDQVGAKKREMDAAVVGNVGSPKKEAIERFFDDEVRRGNVKEMPLERGGVMRAVVEGRGVHVRLFREVFGVEVLNEDLPRFGLPVKKWTLITTKTLHGEMGMDPEKVYPGERYGMWREALLGINGRRLVRGVQ